MNDPIPVKVIKYKHRPNVWWRHILGIFVPKWGPTKYGVVDVTTDGSLTIKHPTGAVDVGPTGDIRGLVKRINSTTDWDQTIIKLPSPPPEMYPEEE